jgi:sarcosine oxidase
VLGLERFELCHGMGSSHGETRVIRLAYFEGSAYVPLVQRAYRLWLELGERTGVPLLFRTGSLEMSEAGYDFVDRSEVSCRDHNLPYELLDAGEIMRRYPAFSLHPGTRAIFQPDGGFVLSEESIRIHTRLATQRGATLQTGETVLGFEETGDDLVAVRTNKGKYTAAQLVLTAGPWMPKLVPALAANLATFKQALAWFPPRRPELFARSVFPVFIHFSSEGEFYGFPSYGSSGIKAGGPHLAREPIDADESDRAPSSRQLKALEGFFDRHLPGAVGPARNVAGCIYTKTPDEHFIIGRLPSMSQVLVVSPCSGHGYKFAPVIGEIVADLVVDGSTRHDISLFSLSRFGGVN